MERGQQLAKDVAEAPGRAARAVSDTAQSLGARAEKLGAQAQMVEENLGNLKAVPGELSEKFQRPFKEVSSAAQGAVWRLSSRWRLGIEVDGRVRG